MLASPEHEAKMIGTAEARTLLAKPMTITDGRFNLFHHRSQSRGHVKYARMSMATEEGKVYYFEGFKIVQHGPLTAVWPATTTLYSTIFDGPNAGSPVLGKGQCAPPGASRKIRAGAGARSHEDSLGNRATRVVW